MSMNELKLKLCFSVMTGDKSLKNKIDFSRPETELIELLVEETKMFGYRVNEYIDMMKYLSRLAFLYDLVLIHDNLGDKELINVFDKNIRFKSVGMYSGKNDLDEVFEYLIYVREVFNSFLDNWNQVDDFFARYLLCIFFAAEHTRDKGDIKLQLSKFKYWTVELLDEQLDDYDETITGRYRIKPTLVNDIRGLLKVESGDFHVYIKRFYELVKYTYEHVEELVDLCNVLKGSLSVTEENDMLQENALDATISTCRRLIKLKEKFQIW